jgi:uncharacterized protein YbaP (TraB family)
MKKILLLSLLLTSCGAKEPQPGAGCVWKISDADSSLYLSGTIHLLREEDHPLPATYDQAYADSQRLLFELPPMEGKQQKLAAIMTEKGKLPAGEALSDKLPVEAWTGLSAWATKRQLSAANFNSFRPWFVALLVTTTEFQFLGAQADQGVEPIFEAKGRADGKTMHGLETVEMQVGLFANLTEAQQNDLLLQTLEEVGTVESHFTEMIRSWRNGEADALYKLLSAEAEHYPELLDLFLHQRNANWIKQLSEELAKPGNAMVLVGAGHLGGEKGVLAGLKAKGFKVERVE